LRVDLEPNKNGLEEALKMLQCFLVNAVRGVDFNLMTKIEREKFQNIHFSKQNSELPCSNSKYMSIASLRHMECSQLKKTGNQEIEGINQARRPKQQS